MKLSILIPVFNEENTITEIIFQVKSSLKDLAHHFQESEIIIINDASTDGTLGHLQKMQQDDSSLAIISQSENQGKGAAIALGITKTTGDIVIIQDADLEYNPKDYSLLLKPFFEKEASVVYGSRFLKKGNHFYPASFWANKVLTLFSNSLSGLHLTDMETCYKVFRGDLLRSIKLECKRFGFEPEVTAKIAKLKGLKILEVPISYQGRGHKEGKKIQWKDGFAALWFIFKYNIMINSDESFKNSN